MNKSSSNIQPPKKHYKIYQLSDTKKKIYVGRCSEENPEKAALKLGTRGLPRENCNVQVLVDCVSADKLDQSKMTEVVPVKSYQFLVEQKMVDLNPGEPGSQKIYPDGKKKIKRIVRNTGLQKNEKVKEYPRTSRGYSCKPSWCLVSKPNHYINPWLPKEPGKQISKKSMTYSDDNSYPAPPPIDFEYIPIWKEVPE